MSAFTKLSTITAFALASLAQARPIPHTVSLFRRAVLDANDGFLVVQNKDAPKDYSESLEPYDHYHFRYMAIGCSDVSKDTQFFDTCCQPRQVGKQSDDNYPAACQLASYLVFDPDYESDKVVAKLGSLRDYQKKIGYSDEEVKEETTSSSSIKKETPSSSSQWTSSSSSWTKSADKPSTSSSVWTSSSAEETWTPEVTSSSSSQWTPEATSSQWTPEAKASPSSSSQAWSEPAAASSSSSETPAPAPSSSAATNNGNNDNNGSASSENFTGQASWFTQNGNPGACGIYHSDSDYIVALQQDMYGNLGQQSQYCGRSLTITNTATGATAQAVVADACPGCATYHSLDLSTGLFQALGNLDQGILPISWHFN
ncbi:hypothetical protein P389DRAFT_19677 [Cystobasidium minutum MCA 4210]|uniref:uncharacterized protein n=1 Tax=Cystobasidium minutum MCA 4210 TaxID=1397322 RepID=UPI0034D01795|eukprot:jgi/Rhomi1/19677/CE19676_4308